MNNIPILKWVSVKEGFPVGRKVLATYQNEMSKRRIVCAVYYKRFSVESHPDDCCEEQNDEYCEDDDTYYIRAGWYECIDNWDNFSEIFIHEGVVDYWMPQPSTESLDDE